MAESVRSSASRAGAEALARERHKQMIAEVAKRNRITVKQCVAFFRHYREVQNERKRTIEDLGYEYDRNFAIEFLEGEESDAEEKAKQLEELHRAHELTFSEYMLGVLYLVRHGSGIERLRYLYQFYDLDADGNVTFKEMHAMLSDHSSSASDGRSEATYTWLKKHFRQADKSGDGLLSFHESVAVLRKHENMMKTIEIDLDRLLAMLKDRRGRIKQLDQEYPTAAPIARRR